MGHRETFELWDVATGTLLHRLAEAPALRAPVTRPFALFEPAPEGNFAIAMGDDGRVRRWHRKKG